MNPVSPVSPLSASMGFGLCLCVVVGCTGDPGSEPKSVEDPDTAVDTGTVDSGHPDSGDTADTSTSALVDADGDGWPATEDCDDQDAEVHPVDEAPEFDLDPCQSGTVFLDNADADQWVVADRMGTTSDVTVGTDEGCRGDALALSYTLAPSTGDGSWVVLRRELEPEDLSASAYLTFPFRGADTADPSFAVELKLEDTTGCRATARFDDASDLPVWRPAVLSLAEFGGTDEGTLGGEECTVDLSQVAAVELAVSDATGDGSGTLYVDDLMVRTLSEVRPDPPDFHECPPSGFDDTLGEIAGMILTRQQQSQDDHGHALVPSWFEEDPTIYYVYDQALALSVLSLEFERTGELVWQLAAETLASEITGLDPGTAGT
ncbi:MAG: hypothetical protein QGG40_12210, partial [Myxococcota bacterium]|nr:hypothetical protein [Myxococcota bacterium]